MHTPAALVILLDATILLAICEKAHTFRAARCRAAGEVIRRSLNLKEHLIRTDLDRATERNLRELAKALPDAPWLDSLREQVAR